MSIHIIVLFLAIITTGMMAGIFFTWTNAVTPGIGKLKDLEYLNVLQSMNRVILNPAFYMVFICPILTLPLVTLLNYYFASSLVFLLSIIATVIYLLGVFFITVAGNIPLNKILDKIDLEDFSLEDAKNLRNEIEIKLNKHRGNQSYLQTAS